MIDDSLFETYVKALDDDTLEGMNTIPRADRSTRGPRYKMAKSLPTSLSLLSCDIDWNHLRLFYYVATARSLARAAQHLDFYPSDLSRTLNQFEQQLGQKLFDRRSPTLKLTPAGEKVFAVAQISFQAVESLSSQFQQDCDSLKGEIWIGIGEPWPTILKALIEFAELYPDIHLHFSLSFSLTQTKKKDVFIGCARRELQEFNWLKVPLASHAICLYAHPDYLVKFGIPEKIEDLCQHRLITYSDRSEREMNWPLEVAQKEKKDFQPFIEVDLIEEGLALASAGLGIFSVYEKYPGLENSGLVQVLSSVPGPQRESAYFYPSMLERVKRFDVLKDYLQNTFKKFSHKKGLESTARSELCLEF